MSTILQFQAESEGSMDPVLLSAALEVCPENLAIVEGGRVLYANRAFAHLFGYAQTRDVQGRPLTEFFPEGCLDSGFATDSVGSERTVRSDPAGEFRSTRKDGIHLHIQTSCVAFRTKNLDLLVISAHDVSQRKEAEQQLRESQRMEAVGRLVGGVAHDFNNLLTGIVLYCGLLINGLGSDRRLRHHVEEIRKAGEQGAALIQQLLAVARQQVVEPRVLSLNQVVRGMQNLLARLIGEDIEMITDLADDLGWVKMDPAHAHQIILNLVLNARDAMPDGGRVTLTSRNRTAPLPASPTLPRNQKPGLTPWVEFAVMDTGCGMSAETRSRLFEPFFTTKRPGQGNGLGLVTAYTILKQDGGTIDVESEPGKGTRVSVCLPRVEQDLDQKSGKRGDSQ